LGDFNACIDFLALVYGNNDVEDYKMAKFLDCFFEYAHKVWGKDYLTILSTFIPW